MACTIDSPRPLPPSFLAPSWVPRWKRSKARAASAGLMPGPASATSMRAPSPAALSRSATGVPAGVCSRTLASRLASTWRIRGSSATTATSAGACTEIGRSGSTAAASAAASRTSRARSVRVRLSEELRSSRASSSSSATSRLIRWDSSSIRRIAVVSWSGSSAPWPYSSAYPRIVVSGVRSSCEASAAN